MTLYYAHAITLYNTPQEVRDMAVFNTLGFNVINPNAPEHDAGYHAEGMDYFRRVVNDADGLAFRALPDGSIPAGIAKEIEFCREAGKPVIELPSGIQRRVLTVEQTREYITEVGAR